MNIYFKKKVLFLSAIIIFLPIVFRFFELQILDYNKYKKLAGNNSLRSIEIKAPRGIIYDRNEVPLVDNIFNYNLEIMPIDIIDKKTKEVHLGFNFMLLDSILGIDKEKLIFKVMDKEKLEKFHPFTMKRFVDFNSMALLKERLLELPGVIFSEIPARKHVSKVNLSHVLGYVRLVNNERIEKLNHPDSTFKYSHGDVYGYSGLEKIYEHKLRGENGEEYRLIDNRGVDQGIFNEKDGRNVVNGPPLVTSIDVNLQYLAESLLTDKVGAIICANPTNGEILSFASSPDFDLKPFNKGPVPIEVWDAWNRDENKPLLNRAISGLYPPGSIFKLITSALLLKKNQQNTKYNCTGEYTFSDNVVKKCWNLSGHGSVNLEEAIKHSCNVYFYKAVENMSFDELIEISKEFNFGERVGIDLPYEKHGLIPTRAYMKKHHEYRDEHGKWITNWAVGGTKANMGIGQGEVQVTPLQVIHSINFIANRGYAFIPHLIKDMSVEKKYVNLSNSDWRFLQDAMYKVVSSGTGQSANIDNKNAIIRGKTGTAQNSQGDGEPHSWFAGYITSSKSLKKMSVVVIIENGGGGAGIASEISNKLFTYFMEIDN